MTLGPPPLPGSLVDMSSQMTISSQTWTKDDSGAAIPTVSATATNVPCSITKFSGAETVRYGYAVDEDVYRVKCIATKSNGTRIIITKDQFLTIDGVKYQTQGGGREEGNSGIQTVIVKRKVR